MARLGISVYPEHSDTEKDKAYIRMAGKYGFSRVFTCLISVGAQSREEIIRSFRELIDTAHGAGMEVILDVNPSVFKKLGIPACDLALFSEMHADGIRLDEGFSAMETSRMTYNTLNLKIELNASLGNAYIDDVISFNPNLDQLVTCHNFYPQRYTGLSLEYFNQYNGQVKKHRLKSAAFISSNAPHAYGPWPVNEGLCTLEEHRDLPIGLQARHLFATGMIDDVIIANAYASEDELKECAAVNPNVLTFGIQLEKKLTEIEKAIIFFEQMHTARGDFSAYVVRSSMTRIHYSESAIAPSNTRALLPGDIVILNDKYGRYKGELQIVLKKMPNDGRKNVVGTIGEAEKRLLGYIGPWKTFAFIEL